MKTIVLGGGCFWCLDAIYKKVEGVTNIESGYAGGNTDSPTYEEVCLGKTGHAEVVRLSFDETKIDLKNILRIFFEVHDPTTINAQGADIGTQYRSVIPRRRNCN
ncbi:MAG: peptide-methionine (S)-S-oxide reductase [Bacteroidota bacterium]|jgi:peptide-methionine (S)-S-oxide reductase|nr:peptide-methionine (S)-S-oxide reductase [Bacteroidota bacterium]